MSIFVRGCRQFINWDVVKAWDTREMEPVVGVGVNGSISLTLIQGGASQNAVLPIIFFLLSFCFLFPLFLTFLLSILCHPYLFLCIDILAFSPSLTPLLLLPVPPWRRSISSHFYLHLFVNIFLSSPLSFSSHSLCLFILPPPSPSLPL